jgi:hypothetical protein
LPANILVWEIVNGVGIERIVMTVIPSRQNRRRLLQHLKICKKRP